MITACLGPLGCSQPKVGAVLTYQVDRTALPAGQVVTIAHIVHVANGRLNRVGKARPLSDDQFVVEVYGDGSDESLDHARRRMEASGNLEFRILASSMFDDHRAIIDAAQKLPADKTIVTLDDEDVARWSPLDSGQFPDAASMRDRGLEIRKADGGWEALVLTNDALNINSNFLDSAAADVDETGKPQLNFTLNQQGAFRFAKLTGDHVPTPTGERYHLAIVWDGSVLTAPSIESKISDRSRISGNFTEQDLADIIAVLNAGWLCPVREVDVKVAPIE